MLRKSARLRAEEVREIIATGRSTAAGAVSAKFLPEKGRSRAAAVVSKAVAKSAVARNRIRRLVYRTLRTSLPPQGFKAVFFVRAVTDSLAEDLAHVCSKLT